MEAYELEHSTKQLGSCAYEHNLFIKGCENESSAVEFAIAWAKENRIVFQKLVPRQITGGYLVCVLQDSGD